MGKRRGTVGSKLLVWRGKRDHTPGGLTKLDLVKSSRGKVVSKKKHALGHHFASLGMLKPVGGYPRGGKKAVVTAPAVHAAVPVVHTLVAKKKITPMLIPAVTKSVPGFDIPTMSAAVANTIAKKVRHYPDAQTKSLYDSAHRLKKKLMKKGKYVSAPVVPESVFAAARKKYPGRH